DDFKAAILNPGLIPSFFTRGVPEYPDGFVRSDIFTVECFILNSFVLLPMLLFFRCKPEVEEFGNLKINENVGIFDSDFHEKIPSGFRSSSSATFISSAAFDRVIIASDKVRHTSCLKRVEDSFPQ